MSSAELSARAELAGQVILALLSAGVPAVASGGPENKERSGFSGAVVTIEFFDDTPERVRVRWEASWRVVSQVIEATRQADFAHPIQRYYNAILFGAQDHVLAVLRASGFRAEPTTNDLSPSQVAVFELEGNAVSSFVL